jgi:GNAT superfamily N-acetyltransferase
VCTASGCSRGGSTSGPERRWTTRLSAVCTTRVFFHQLGGFGPVALTPDGEDDGYLLGVVSADRLGVVHALAVHPAWRGRGVAVRLVERFAALAASVGARVVQAVAPPGDAVVRGLAGRFGAHEASAPSYAGPGADRVLFTRSLV